MSFETVWQFFPYLWHQFRERRLQDRAAALTYMTLFAIVPMLTVIYSMFSLVPSFQGLGNQLEAMLYQHMLPDSGLEISNYLQTFSSQARSLTLAGIGLLVVTAYLMLKNIERAFNDIWGIKESRKGLSNFLLYWAVLSLGPLLLGVGLAMSTYLLSLKLFVEGDASMGIIPQILNFAPWLLTTLAFTLLFAAVPNCKVPMRHAVVGGVLTAVCFELLKDLFGWIVANSSFQVIYGAFAMVPLFLLWVNILWMIVLTGAVLVRSLSGYGLVSRGRVYPDLIASLLVLWTFEQGRKTGVAIDDDQVLKVGIETEQWQRLRRAFKSNKIIAITQSGDYVLSRDLNELSLRRLADVVGIESHLPGVSDYLQTFDWLPEVAARLLSIDQHTELEFDITIAEIFSSHTQQEQGTSDLAKIEGFETTEMEAVTDEGAGPITQSQDHPTDLSQRNSLHG
ncbi:MAG: YihY family inner membrane protein [Candidatus Pelagadaptatus aseana]|uniref:YihY family inner membrane protein n=1 Tax=Candidatus Pelagadaptatus aseana TaxID=3120508 RepID=UPI0039B17989